MKRLIAAFAVALAASAAWAQTFTISAGAPTGSTYTQMGSEWLAACSTVPARIINSTGGLENIDRLVGNKVSGAIVPTDALFLRARSEDLTGVKTLVALHPEEVHVLVLSAGIKRKGISNTFAATLQPRTVSDLESMTVGAWGASTRTANLVSEYGRLGWTVVDVGNADGGVKALAARDIDVLLAAAGAPASWATQLGQAYRLVGFDGGLVEALAKIYVPAQISYSNLGSGAGVKTVATEALFVIQNYPKTTAYAGYARELRRCLANKLEELQYTDGTHPKWKKVSMENHGKWAGYWEGK